MVGVEVLRIRQLTHTTLIIGQIFAQQRFSLRLAQRRIDARAVLALRAVVAVPDGFIAIDVVVVGTETFERFNELDGAVIDRGCAAATGGPTPGAAAGAGNAALNGGGARTGTSDEGSPRTA